MLRKDMKEMLGILMKFIWLIIKCIVCAIIVPSVGVPVSFWGIFLFLIYTILIVNFLHNEKYFSPLEKAKTKYIYIGFGILYGISVCLSFVHMEARSILQAFITEHWINLLSISYKSFNEAILIAIIFDVAIQLLERDVVSGAKNYLQELASEGRLYTIENSESNEMMLWCVRGGGCADIVDNIKQFKIRKNYKYKIILSEEAIEEIRESRERYKAQDKRSLLYGDAENYFHFILLNFSDIKRRGLEFDKLMLEENFLKFPEEARIEKYKFFILVDYITLYLKRFLIRKKSP